LVERAIVRILSLVVIELLAGRGVSPLTILAMDATRSANTPNQEAALTVSADPSRMNPEALQDDEWTRHAQKMEAVGRLAGGVAHQFNNLLTVITGYTCVLLETHGPGDPDHAALAQIQQAADRTATLVRQLLAFGGRQMLKLCYVNLNDLLLHRCEICKRLLGPTRQLHLNLDPTLPTVYLDPGQIEQVLLDLTANARDAMPSGGQFTLTTSQVCTEARDQLHAHLPPGPLVRLTVCDTGRGMDERTMSRLFEPFFTTKEVGQGVGLSLASVYGTIKQCGGNVAVASQSGQGTTFTIDFLAAPLPSAETSSTPRYDPTRTRPKSETILLVDDEKTVRTLAGHVLRNHGYTVLEACDGEEALEVYARQAGNIDLLVSDVMMPNLTGMELAERLAALAPQLRVLFLSGYQKDEADPEEDKTAAPLRFLTKPFRPADLIATVRELLSQPRRCDSGRITVL
jgi:signal transduction histidine kinase/CheY-like chemotaxis protein